MGLIYQFNNLIPTLNVVETITLPILMDKRKVNEQRLNDLLTIGILAVLLIIFVTMMYTVNKLGRENIIDALRDATA